ncbi:hypothetical protein F4804DRAFT_347672 [Jackrogersella minutella]|nr:hypothetical protein F4804DRAFT_347672 [Jackrogersella minutella]
MAHETEQDFIREVWGLQGAAYLVVILRYYNRIATLGWRCLAWDDTIMFVATMVYTAESLMAYLVVAFWKGLANNAMSDEHRAALNPQSHEWNLRVNGSKTHVAGLLLYTTLLWLLKACWLIYYTRLTKGVDRTVGVIQWGIGIVAATYISCLLVAFLKCIPFHNQWQINPAPGNHCMPAISTLQTVYVMVTNTLTDFYLMAIPIPMIWNSHLPWRKKFVLMIMFSGGFLEMAFGIMRCVSILTLGDTDPSQSGYWSVRESFVSVVLTNMPMVYPMFKKFLDKGRIIGKSNFTSQDSRGYKLDSRSGPLETIGRLRSTERRQKPLSSAPKDTTFGSLESIVIDRDQGTASTGEEASIDLPKHHVNVISFADNNEPPSGLGSGSGSGSGTATATDGDNQILVIKEVIVTEENPPGPRTFNRLNI